MSANDPIEGAEIMLQLVDFDVDYLDRSWVWLNDPEMKDLTMTPSFSREQQRNFFAELPNRPDYLIWGVHHSVYGAIGAAGLKNHRGDLAEYWGYIGNRECWGRGLGRQLVDLVLVKARELGFIDVDLKVSENNVRAIALYEKCGFEFDSELSEGVLHMVRRSI